MNNARLLELERSQTSVARTVLEAVPISDPWEISRIHNECARRGHNFDRTKVIGCLNSLMDSGLVREPRKGLFIRVAPRPKLVSEQAPDVSQKSAPVEPARPAEQRKESAMDILADLGAELRSLSSAVVSMADKVDRAAVDVEEQMQKLRDETDMVRKLKALLRSVD